MSRRASFAEHAGRLALAWVFLRAGSDVLRDPSRAARTAGPLLGRLRRRAPVAQRPNQRNHFNKNLAIMGALVLAARRRPGPG